jgi:glycosyltransferase involved in cell wall biosynthesis
MYHGSLVERNGLELAIEAFSTIRQSIPGAELRIYGASNPFLEGVLARVESKGLTGVRYLGARTLEGIVQAISECDVGIIPNQRNIFAELNTPTRIFEYLALGKPVIAPNSAGIRDYFSEDSLIFFELGNAADLGKRIEFVFTRPELAAQVAKRGQQVHRSHSWRQERLRLLECVTATLSPKPGGKDATAEGINV